MKIEQVGIPKSDGRTSPKWATIFPQMKPGDSFHFEGAAPQTVVTSFAYFCAKGRYILRKEGSGYRFYLVR